MKPVVIDWDDTLVHTSSQEWIDGAEQALRVLLMGGRRVVVHSCRANWPEGREQIESKLSAHGLNHPNLTIEGKPDGCIYIDNLGHRFTDWADALAAIPQPPVAVRPRTLAATTPRLAPRRTFGGR